MRLRFLSFRLVVNLTYLSLKVRLAVILGYRGLIDNFQQAFVIVYGVFVTYFKIENNFRHFFEFVVQSFENNSRPEQKLASFMTLRQRVVQLLYKVREDSLKVFFSRCRALEHSFELLEINLIEGQLIR